MTSRFLFRLILSFVVCCLATFEVLGQDTSAQETKKSKLEKEIAQLEQQIRSNSKKNTNALSELTLIRKQISVRRELLEQSDKEIKAIRDSISLKEKRGRALQARLDTLSLYYRRLVSGAYRNRDSRLWYSYIFASSSLSQASRRYSYFKGLSAQMNLQGRKIKDLKADLEAQLSSLQTMRGKAEALRAQRAKDLDRLKGDEKRSKTLVANLKRDKTRFQRQLNDKKKQVQALNKEIERIIAQSMSSRKAGGKPVDIKLSSEFEANKGKLPWPAEGPVVERFGQHNHPVYTTLVMPFNNGCSIVLDAGTAIKAVFDGEVKNVIVMPGYNKCVLVQHGGYFSFYCKLSKVEVKAGDKVKTGQRLGVVDTIDGQTQLHFQIWKERTPQDPEEWLR